MTRVEAQRAAIRLARPGPGTEAETETDELTFLREQLEEVQARLADSAETLRAISAGEVDALMVGALSGREHVFTLTSADRPYRNFVETCPTVPPPLPPMASCSTPTKPSPRSWPRPVSTSSAPRWSTSSAAEESCLSRGARPDGDEVAEGVERVAIVEPS
jgi:hypothetical protein